MTLYMIARGTGAGRFLISSGDADESISYKPYAASCELIVSMRRFAARLPAAF